MKTILLIFFLSFLHAAELQAQSDMPLLTNKEPGPVMAAYASGYGPGIDVSKMGDTVITEYGNMDTGGTIFYPQGYGHRCFAMRRMTVSKGKLREVHMEDHNTGDAVTVTFDDKGKMKTIKLDSVIVTNGPTY